MLPKEEKIDQKLDLNQPSLFEKENKKDRISKKRKFIYVAMFLTVGLSLFFWIYRSLKSFTFSPKLPNFSFNISTPKVKVSSPILPEDSSTWSVFLKKTDSNGIIYQKNREIIFNDQDLNTILNKIDKSDFIVSSLYSFSLPEGFKIKELVEENDNNFNYFAKIITPNQELLLIIKISDSKDLNQAKKSIPNLIDQFYWYSLQK
jgi:hypothetical protein